MPSVNVTLTSYDKKEGQGQRGPWTLHLFKDSAGQSYQTFEAPISNRAYGLLNKPVVLEYKDKPAKNPEYPPNKEIVDIQLDVAALEAIEDEHYNPPTNALTSGAPLVNSGDDRQIQIMRQSALERAIRFYGYSGQAYGEVQIYELSEEFLHYFQTGEYPGSVPQSGTTGEYPGKSEAQIIADLNDIAA